MRRTARRRRSRAARWLPFLAVLVAPGCASSRPVPLPLLEPTGTAAVAPDDGELGSGAVAGVARHLIALAPAHEAADLSPRTLDDRSLWESVGTVVNGSTRIHRSEVGQSVQGRPLYSLEFGRGPVRVLLWSQMHGNEPTATLALVDLLRFVVANPADPLVRRIEERLTVVMVPMLNPDGAQQRRRENAMGIDVNRDARRQSTPEARALATVHSRVSPHFGFNLHDQSLRIAADGRPVAIALLAPPHEERPSEMLTLRRAKQVAGIMRVAADSLVDGRVSRYDEPYSAHAFGDAMQSWGTSTILLETGAWDDDPEMRYLRRVNFALLLTALDAIATRSFERASPEWYETLSGQGAGPARREN
jgi:hypothetical protein